MLILRDEEDLTDYRFEVSTNRTTTHAGTSDGGKQRNQIGKVSVFTLSPISAAAFWFQVKVADAAITF